ncbi:endonuclease domain-containing protein [Agrobacterium sp. NPDC089420]|uniref:endonuclease domain-containing protein n=1 Tax=Agrobacterium sp. NPDC089420 TaxID=3363918 RepID=UPI0038513917
MQESYALVHTEVSRRIVVIMSPVHGAFVLTKACRASTDCGCLACALFDGEVETSGGLFPALDLKDAREMRPGLMAYTITPQGKDFIDTLDRQSFADYRGPIGREQVTKLFERPSAVLIIRQETDETFTHSLVSATINGRVISRGCRASPHCPCVGCRIVDMYYTEKPGHLARVADITATRSTKDGAALLPIFVDDTIISAMLNRDPAIRHAFNPNPFDSPLERMFFELAFLDLHLYPQHQVGKYQLDFAIPDKRLAIELDGHEYHKTKYQRTHDARRDRWLFGQGWSVLRFTGTELSADLDRCIDEICMLVGTERLSPR